MKKKVLIILGWIVSLVFLYFTFREIQFGALWSTLKSANYWWVIPNILVIMFTMVYRAYRWQIMLDPIKHVGLHDLFASTMVGFMASNILPLRMGEIVRAYSVGKLGKLSRSSSFATIVLERIFDILTLLLMLAVIMIFRLLPLDPMGENYNRIVYAGYMMLVLSVVIMLILVFLKVKQQKTIAFFRKLLSIFPDKLSSLFLDILDKFADGLGVLSNLSSMIRIIVHSILLWIVTALSNYFVFQTTPLESESILGPTMALSKPSIAT